MRIYQEVEGLISGAKVSINGLSVGKISKIDFLPNTTKILVTMDVREELDFSNKSTACFMRLDSLEEKPLP